jgi:PAS domain S-box-containing protein
MKSLSCPDARTRKLGFIGVARDVLETIGDGFCAIDGEWQIVYVNLRVCEMWGWTPETLIGGVFWNVFPQMAGTTAEKLLRGAVEAGSRVECEMFSPIIERWLWVRVCPMSEGITGLYWRDISAEKTAKAALRESEERFRRVFEQSPLGMATADLDGRFREVNPALSRMLGYASEDLPGLSYLDIVHPDDHEECARQGRAAAAGAIPHFQLEGRFIRKSGEPIWVSINVSPVSGQDGRVLYTLGIIESIEERRRAEEELQQANELLEQRIEERTRQLSASQARLQAHFNNSPDWLTLFRARKDGAFVYEDLNPATERACGLKRDQVIGRRLEEVLGVEPAQLPLRHMRACLRTRDNQRYIARRTMAGVTRTIDVLFVLVPEQQDGDSFIIATARDITEMRHIEDQLHQAQKLEAVGQLTGGIAHDFNNLLTSVLGNLELLRARLGASDQSSARLLSAALTAAERGARLTTQLLVFSRQQRLAPEPVDLNQIITGMAGLLQSAVGATNRIEVALADQLSLALADRSQIELVILNLAINARDAMPGGGTITIGTSNVRLGAPVRPEEPPLGGYVMCSVSDTGTGIPNEILDKVFEPFFTTKEVGKGSGLGLSPVLGVAKQLGGGVRIETYPEARTTFNVYLPAANGVCVFRTAALTKLGPDPETADFRQAVVLLVDDDAEVRAATTEMLRYAGHDVVEAGSGREALDCLDQHGDRIDLMIVDYVMPGMNGVEVARLGRLKRPRLPILFITGFADTAVLATETGEDHFLQKPFYTADLVAKMEGALRTASERFGEHCTPTAKRGHHRAQMRSPGPRQRRVAFEHLFAPIVELPSPRGKCAPANCWSASITIWAASRGRSGSREMAH